MHIADQLSRNYLKNTEADNDNIKIVNMISEIEEVNGRQEIAMSPVKSHEMQEFSNQDEQLTKLKHYIKQGWPNDKKDIEDDVRVFFSI